MSKRDLKRSQEKMHSPSRSRFVRNASLAGLGLAAMSAPRVHAAGSDQIKIALIGCGGRGTGAAMQALSTKEPVVLWSMADIFSDRLESSLEMLTRGAEARYDREESEGFASRIDVPKERRFVGFEAYKQAIDSGVDAALLVTFPHFRAEQFEYAVKQGVHVFQEKPLAVDAPSIRRILAANEIAKQKNLKVGVGLQRHHNPVYQEIVEKIHGGAIGDLMMMRCYWNGGGGGGLGERVEDTEMEFQLRNRYYFTWLCGDHNVEQHIHNIDVCNWVLQGHPTEANGMGGRQIRNGRDDGEIFDHHAVEYTYPNDVKMFSVCRQIAGCRNKIGEAAHGTLGVAELNQRESTIQTAEGLWKTERSRANPYQVEHDVLFDAIANDLPHNETEYAALATMTAIMGRMATYSGKVVTWDEAINSDISLTPDRYAMDGTPPVLPDGNGVYPCAMPGTTKAV